MSQELEKQHAEQMNQEAVARIKAEENAKITARSEAVWFEDDEQITLRDGSIRKLPPMLMADARAFMQKVREVNIDAIILNFAPGSGNAEGDLYDIFALAFRNYKDMVTLEVSEDGEETLTPNRKYMDRVIDIRMARKIIDQMLDVNALKK